MNVLRGFFRPYYFYRPSQILRRLSYETVGRKTSGTVRWVNLPWGVRMQASAVDDLGHSLLTAGINDLILTEALCRMIDPGELAVDVGANVGYTTGILATHTGNQGKVISFEPHPDIYRDLRTHIADWEYRAEVALGTITAVNSAVSDKKGLSTLIEPTSFRTNRGESRLGSSHDASMGGHEEGRKFETTVIRLDDALKNQGPVGVMKVDVEGHEAQVFAGASEVLETGQVRDIAFEEFDTYPAATHRMLEERGYSIFTVEEHLWGPKLIAANKSWKNPKYDPPNYFASRDPERLNGRFRAKGWRCMKCLPPTK
jgi:FkbM family methyltransferase